MRVLVIGANGYIASRVIPQLLEAGHEVLAGARSTEKLDAFWWREQVTPVEIDVLDADSVRAAVTSEIDGIVYLVHGMASDDFSDADRAAAEHVRDAVAEAGVQRVVYVSGIIPDIPDEDLSEHLTSRLEVERVLSEAPATVVTLRAAMVFGGGSTSFELMRQLADRLPVTVLPDWMEHRVEPIAVSDLARAVAGALEADVETGHFDVGGGEPILYPDLIKHYTELNDSERPQLTIGFGLLPEKLVAQVAAWIASVPSPTVKALIESLQEDMVAADERWKSVLLDDPETVSLDDAIQRALSDPGETPDAERDPLQRWDADPDWATE